jgi:hypothetical protein
MNRALPIITLGFQTSATFIITFGIYLVYTELDNNFGFNGLFSLFIIQPLFGAVFSVFTIVACFVAGLPIRLLPKLNDWWKRNIYIAVTGVICGLTILLLGLLPGLREPVATTIDGKEVLKLIPNSGLTYTGWFATAFFLMHIHVPKQITGKVARLFCTGNTQTDGRAGSFDPPA